jgi:LPXTG-motif cell wall-anchored protein
VGIVNRRNAVLGWGVWQVGKATAKHKARQAVKPDEKRLGKKSAVAGGLAAAGGALWFWRRRRNGGSET